MWVIVIILIFVSFINLFIVFSRHNLLSLYSWIALIITLHVQYIISHVPSGYHDVHLFCMQVITARLRVSSLLFAFFVGFLFSVNSILSICILVMFSIGSSLLYSYFRFLTVYVSMCVFSLCVLIQLYCCIFFDFYSFMYFFLLPLFSYCYYLYYYFLAWEKGPHSPLYFLILFFLGLN
jgi:hypothetical protein